ncbi:PREDICTED: coiled-coil domain-containing protein 15 isoform X1 [Miniopterus natalensis]|uniref:coiled-coil domain-containing protein 15 isoform X1 n=1 Tax=Miniopterus natalensis TaxID=291302 RepID=UPI0007A72328|nr:PREDICTED: coiled-coil domain-containing protein 15 isoform X1 [Miniopterus natalensis]
MAPLKKRRNTTRLPLALNPLKSKDVLAVLAERNQAIVPVGAWVEPASPHSSEIPAHTSAYMIEEELKEQLRKKQEALKRFQKQVKHRVNQQIRLRKKQQLQKSYEAAQKEGSIAKKSSDSAHLTPKRTSVFQNNSNAAIGSASLPPSQMFGDGIEDRENQNQLIQQAQALSQTMKQARHRLASFKTVNNKNASVFSDDTRKCFPIQEEPDAEESSSVAVDSKRRESWLWWHQQDVLLEQKDRVYGRVRKVQFKNPLFAIMEEEELQKLHLQDTLPETQDYIPKVQVDLLETQGDLTGVQSIDLEAQNIEPHTQGIELEGHTVEGQAVEPKAQAIEPEAQVVKTKPRGFMLEAQNIELEDGNMLDVQDFLSPNQAFLPKDQNILPTCQDQNILPNGQNILLRCQDQHFLHKDQHVLPKDQNVQPKYQDQDFIPKDQHIPAKDQIILLKSQDQHFLPRDQCVLSKEQNTLPKCQDQDFLPRYQNMFFKQPSSFVREERARGELLVECHRYVNPQVQDQASLGDQSLYSRQQPSAGAAERRRDLLPDGHHCLPPKHRREASGGRQVCDKCQSRLSTECQAPPTFRFGADQEEDRKERQKRYLRYRRLFMDIEREQVKEQQRQKEHRKRIEKIKEKKEQQRRAEEQRMLRTSLPEEHYSGEKISEMLARLRLEEAKGAGERERRRAKERQRYVEALRAQIQEKMRLYNITLPPLCCCGPDFWDAHPDTCANNCIFYKNPKAYTRALHSVINSCDTPEGNSALRAAIHNFASAHRRTMKNV